MLCALLAAVSSGAQEWTSIGPFGGQTASAVLWDSPFRYLYAAIDGVGVFRSPDLGSTWVPAGAGLTDPRLSALVLEYPRLPCAYPGCVGVVFASTRGGGVFVLRGSTWTADNSGLTDLEVNTLVADFNGVWAGTAGGRLFRSIFADVGPQTWSRVDAPSDGTPIRSIAVSSDGATVFFGTDLALYRSQNGGASWSRLQETTLFSLGAVRSITVDRAQPSTVYAAGTLGCHGCGAPAFPAILKSLDAGDTWSDISGDIANRLVDVLLITETGSLFAGTASGVSRSIDGGASWTSSGLGGLEVDALTETPFPLSESVPLAAGTVGRGVYRADLPIRLGCQSDGTTLCLRGGRFAVRVCWRTAREGGNSGDGQAMPLTVDSGAFWFFQPSNIELVVKVLDGRSVNNHFWVFWGALSDVGYTITVTDVATGLTRIYENSEGRLASGADTAAF
jgi:hypothetical protein